MNKAIIGVIVAAIIVPITVYAISPYFTESSIDEALPENVVTTQTSIKESKMMESEERMMEKKDVMMESEEMMMEKKDVMMESEEMMMEEMILKMYEGQFIGVGDGIHDAQGIAKVLPLEDGSQILRLEEFRSTNGPDLYVYLATDKHASDFVNLGELKANQGNQNYEIPDDVNLEEYNQVLIWCKAFSVLFGNAELMSQ